MWLGRSTPRTSRSPRWAAVRRRRRRDGGADFGGGATRRGGLINCRALLFSERGLAEHAGQRRDRPDGAEPEHERPLDQITETAFEADLEVRHLLVDFDKPDAHFLTQLGDIRA